MQSPCQSRLTFTHLPGSYKGMLSTQKVSGTGTSTNKIIDSFREGQTRSSKARPSLTYRVANLYSTYRDPSK
jgi:hypothetical protein